MPWFDVDDDFYAKKLPAEIAEIREQVYQQQDADFTGISLFKDYRDALRILSYSNRAGLNHELIVVRSEKLVHIKGSFPFAQSRVKWIGYDYVALGYWSLLCDGLYLSPTAFSTWTTYLNEHGLMPSPAYLKEFVVDYTNAVQAQLVEEVPDGGYGYDAIEIGIVDND